MNGESNLVIKFQAQIKQSPAVTMLHTLTCPTLRLNGMRTIGDGVVRARNVTAEAVLDLIETDMSDDVRRNVCVWAAPEESPQPTSDDHVAPPQEIGPACRPFTRLQLGVAELRSVRGTRWLCAEIERRLLWLLLRRPILLAMLAAARRPRLALGVIAALSRIVMPIEPVSTARGVRIARAIELARAIGRMADRFDRMLGSLGVRIRRRTRWHRVAIKARGLVSS